MNKGREAGVQLDGKAGNALAQRIAGASRSAGTKVAVQHDLLLSAKFQHVGTALHGLGLWMDPKGTQRPGMMTRSGPSSTSPGKGQRHVPTLIPAGSMNHEECRNIVT